MKTKSTSQSAFANRRVLTAAFIGLTGVSLALLGARFPFSNAFAQGGAKERTKEERETARETWERLRLQDEHGQIPPNALRKSYEQKKAMPFRPEAWAELLPKREGLSPEQAEQLMWTSIGPENIGGRIRSIVIDPNAPTTMWLGAVGGGVWKTTDGGMSWSTNTDFLANLAVNCLALSPIGFNGPTIYAGTGEGYFNADEIQGNGIFKTTNGGTTWAQLSSTANNPNFYWVNRLAISPSNPQLLLAGTQYGLFRSSDSGGTWSQRMNTLGVLDVVFHPTDGTKCIAGIRDGIAYYSTDAGLTWIAATGLPPSAGRVEVAYSRSNPLIVYANVEYNGGQLYRSSDGGHSYAAVGAPGTGASWYNDPLWVDPTNSNTLVFGGGNLYRSTDGGVTRTTINSPHPDYHVVVQDPGYDGVNNKIAYCGNDGGIFKTTNILASPVVWTSLNHTLGITQFYGGAGNATSGTIIGGTQDNGTVTYLGDPNAWITMFGGDGGFCAADQTDLNYFYGEYINLQIYRSTNGGHSAGYIYNGITDAGTSCANFVAPFVLDPSNPNTLLAGGAHLWRSTNVKTPQPSWTAIKPALGCNNNISATAVAPNNSNIIWVGYNDGSVWYTTNGTATNPTWTQANNGLPARYCTRLTVSMPPGGLSATIYACFGSFNSGNVWKTTNNGATWTNIHNNLPQIPIYSLVVSPLDSSQLYAGTQMGVFASSDGGAHWSPSNEAPANTVVDELFWVGTNLVAATHGRSMFTATIQP